MSSFTQMLLVVACAALLQVGCEAWYRNRKNLRLRPSRRNNNDRSIALGRIEGLNIITLPVIHLGGPDVIVGFPDNCAGKGLELLGTALIVSNSDLSTPVDLVADDAKDPRTNVAIHCINDYGKRCPSGVDVISYQHCGRPLVPPTTTETPSSSSSESSSESSSKSASESSSESASKSSSESSSKSASESSSEASSDSSSISSSVSSSASSSKSDESRSTDYE